jgi:hypothetical protein
MPMPTGSGSLAISFLIFSGRRILRRVNNLKAVTRVVVQALHHRRLEHFRYNRRFAVPRSARTNRNADQRSSVCHYDIEKYFTYFYMQSRLPHPYILP